ncbi:probable protein phosphatase 2C 33 [Andrographis paniculata]|uniref:probable protein phosphatase 2C 33 n=1 Tax=Andrographis paniculata TaxID=175694 RepID=UPI0021E91804|nr:probable protein phosphatase 2C 33 [Andrographis paniculata]
MGSCLSGESRSPRAGSPLGGLKRKKRLGSRNSSFDYGRDDQLHRTPGRMFVNGSSDRASLFTQQGKKGTNQDAMLVWENFCLRNDTIFCGVFDGHGPYGHLVARRVRDSLPLKLNEHWGASVKIGDGHKEPSLNNSSGVCSEDTPFLASNNEARASADEENEWRTEEPLHGLKESFLRAYKVMDRELRSHTNIDCFCSGTTAVTLVKQGRDLVIGNVGDSRAVLATRDENNYLSAVQLTVDLKPSLPGEAERIRKCKGRVFALQDEPEVARVWLPNYDSPGLAMARAFGDFCLKDFGLISVPEVSYRRITNRDEFIVLATDGIWDVLSNKEVVDIVDSCAARANAARSLVESAVQAWRCKYPTSKVDDCAVVCLFLDPNESENSGRDNSSSGGGARPNRSGHEEVSEAEEECSEDDHRWSALEGVSRVNTLMDLPTFKPQKDDGHAGK